MLRFSLAGTWSARGFLPARMQRLAAKMGLGTAVLSSAAGAATGGASTKAPDASTKATGLTDASTKATGLTDASTKSRDAQGAWDVMEAPLTQPELHAARATAVTLLYGRDFARKPASGDQGDGKAVAKDAAEGVMATAERALVAPPPSPCSEVDLRAVDFDRVVNRVLLDPGVQHAVFRALREDFFRAAARDGDAGGSLLPAFEDFAELPQFGVHPLFRVLRAVERLKAGLGGAAGKVEHVARAALEALVRLVRGAGERATEALRPEEEVPEADATLAAAVNLAALIFTLIFAQRLVLRLDLLRRTGVYPVAGGGRAAAG